MKVSLKWLSKYVDISDISPEELASKLTFAGIEVEEVQHLASGTNLVIGQIIECENHPDSNHLHILKVDCGSKIGIKQIVCGAPNARKGLKVIVAQEGAVLPQITITRGSIRGVESCGMCCALFELGVDKKYLTDAQINGIEELPEDAEVGNENVLEYLGLDDVVLDLKLLANRSDCNSLLNVAKEVGALYSRPVRLPKPTLVETTPVDFKVSSATDKCPLFYAKVMKNVKIGPSPKWLQDSLVAMGVRSINSIVDIGNYIMLLTGQPLHMYDLDKLTSASLVARDDYEGDFVALDEQTYKVLKGDLVICNDGKPMCLGGVMGSLACAVDENTKNIVIEAAYFNAASIRKTSIRLNLISESSSRFVKGINPHQHEYVLNLAAQCVRELCDCHDESAIIKYDVMNHDLLKIPFTCEKINNRLGTTFSDEQILDVLKQVGIEINKCESGLEAIIPAHRIDMTCVADLSEEVIRILGFDNITSQLPTLKTIVGGLNEKQLKKR
ncbi:MAG: phenylalanine--tRNA ligase subunit beta, partial [Bacilli bacterium]